MDWFFIGESPMDFPYFSHEIGAFPPLNMGH
jgi:hypothetical protein